MNSIYEAMTRLGKDATSTYPDCRGLVISVIEPVSTDCINSLVNAGKVVLYRDAFGTPQMDARVLAPR